MTSTFFVRAPGMCALGGLAMSSAGTAAGRCGRRSAAVAGTRLRRKASAGKSASLLG